MLDLEKLDFDNNGFILIRNLLKESEVDVLKAAIENCMEMQIVSQKSKDRFSIGERSAFETLFVWNDVGGNDPFAKATRKKAIFDRLRLFFDDEPYVYHNKVATKYPGVEGFRMHQDYYYWYGMGNLYPNMATVQIAVEACTPANGCLRVIPGSHKMGRIDHQVYTGEWDTGIELERLNEILKVKDVLEIELNRGDAVLFHSNLIHGSGDNSSSNSRLTLLGCYNTKMNSPFKRTAAGHPDFFRQSTFEDLITSEDLHIKPNFSLKYL